MWWLKLKEIIESTSKTFALSRSQWVRSKSGSGGFISFIRGTFYRLIWLRLLGFNMHYIIPCRISTSLCRIRAKKSDINQEGLRELGICQAKNPKSQKQNTDFSVNMHSIAQCQLRLCICSCSCTFSPSIPKLGFLNVFRCAYYLYSHDTS